MKVIGGVTTGVVCAIGVLAIVVAISSTPDIKRYLEMRRM